MLRAIGLGCLGQNHRAAMAHQQIAGSAQGRIGGDAGVAVRATALQRHGELGGGGFFAPGLVGLGELLTHEINRRQRGLAAAAHVLNVHGAQAAGKALLLHQTADLVHLAPQAQHDHRMEIHMPRIAAQGAAQHGQRLVLRHAAAGLVGQRHHAIDMGELDQGIMSGDRIGLEIIRHHLRHMR